MNLRQSGFVHTGRKRLANPRGWSSYRANVARGPSAKRAPRALGLRLGPSPPAARLPSGPRPSWPCRSKFGHRSGPLRTHGVAKNWGQGRGGALTPGFARPAGPPGRSIRVLPCQKNLSGGSGGRALRLLGGKGKGLWWNLPERLQTSGPPSDVGVAQAGSSVAGPQCAADSPGHCGGFVPSPRKTRGHQGSGTHWEGRSIRCKSAVSEGTVPCHGPLGPSEQER